MAKIAKKVLFWGSVNDAGRYKVRVIPNGVPFSYAATPVAEATHVVGQAEHEADLAGLSIPEGVYDIYVTAEDSAGNESDPLEFQDAQLDFTPPAAPAFGGFRE
jgi:hypothetical protein